MPPRTPKACRVRGCPNTSLERHGYCPEHAHLAKQGWEKSRKNKTTTERGYGHFWRKLRAAVLRRDKHLCQICKAKGKVTPATEVDHIKPKFEGGKDELTNLQAICDVCHKIKTKQEAVRSRGRGESKL